MPTISHLDHLVLTVKNIELSTAFYESVLGMQKTIFGQGRIALSFGNQKINLHEVGKEFEPKAKTPVSGSADLCFLSNDSIETWIDHFKKNEITIEEGPVQRTGATGPILSIYIRDLDGNLIEISNQID